MTHVESEAKKLYEYSTVPGTGNAKPTLVVQTSAGVALGIFVRQST